MDTQLSFPGSAVLSSLVCTAFAIFLVNYSSSHVQAPAGAPASQPAPQTPAATFGAPPNVAQSAPPASQQPQQYTFSTNAPGPADAQRNQASPPGVPAVPAPKTRFGPPPPGAAFAAAPGGIQEPQPRQDYPTQAPPQPTTAIPTQIAAPGDPGRNSQPPTQDGSRGDSQVCCRRCSCAVKIRPSNGCEDFFCINEYFAMDQGPRALAGSKFERL